MLYIIIVVIVIIIIISFMQGIYTYILETNYVPREYSVATVLFIIIIISVSVSLSPQGLRIAPPEAPVTGYMFGKGIYFADMVSKSANYCFTSHVNSVGLMLLCEVALGNM